MTPDSAPVKDYDNPPKLKDLTVPRDWKPEPLTPEPDKDAAERKFKKQHGNKIENPKQDKKPGGGR